jgi:hypothetical protein
MHVYPSTKKKAEQVVSSTWWYTDDSDQDFHDLPEFLQALQIRQWPLPSFPVHYLLIIPSFDTTYLLSNEYWRLFRLG